jgi:hypothetical protein|nr:Ig-like domain-containing protein [uncultured Steroidobacter sp.]
MIGSFRRSALAALICALSACGGGGGGGATNPPSPPINTAPRFTTLAFDAVEDAPVSARLVATDAEAQAITFALVTNPSHGAVSDFTSAGAFTYLATSNYVGIDTFTVSARDSAGAETIATITITVGARNDLPSIRDDVITASGTNPLVDVLANDTDSDGEPLTITIEGTPDFGTAAVENGRVRLTLPAGFQGFNTFTYRAVDAAGEGAAGRVVVFIDTEPVRFFYVTNEEGAYARNLYGDDLIARNPITAFTDNEATALGRWVYVSDNGRTVLFDEIGNMNAPSGRRFWTVAPADGSGSPRRLNGPLAIGESAEDHPVMSSDGRWVVYRIRDANSVDHFYLADVTRSDAPREITAPVMGGAYVEDAFDFDAQSRYLFMSVTMPNAAGMAIYRAPVTDPSAAQMFFPAAANRGAYTGYVDTDGSRAIVIGYGATETRLYLARASDPANPLVLSPGAVHPESMMGSYRADWLRNRLIFNVDTVPGSSTYTSTIHVADLATGNWTALGAIPGDLTRPEFIDLHPSENTALFSTTLNDPVIGISDELREVDLVAGAPTRLQSETRTSSAQYVNAGASVLIANRCSLQVLPRNDPTHAKDLFTDACATNHRFSRDGKNIMVSAAPWSDTSSSDSIWAISQTTGAGTFAKRLVQVTTQPFTYVSVATVAPRY